MPKRMIDTDLWNDEDIISDFTAEDKYFWLYLLTNPHNKLCGVLKNSPSLIARDIGLHKDTITNLIYRFERIHKVIYCDKETNEIFILNWYKYNWTKSPKIVEIIRKEQKDVKSEHIVDLITEKISIILGEKEDTLSIGYQYPSNSNTNTNSNDILEDGFKFKDSEEDSIGKKIQSKNIALNSEFDEVWKLYPNKQGRETARSAYIKARKEGISREEIEDGVKRYVEYCKAKSLDKQYIKHGSTWFNKRSWNDDYSIETKVEVPKYSNTNAEDALERALARANEKSSY